MHLVFMVRGIQQQVDIWKKFMETQMFDWKRQPLLRGKDGSFLKNPDGSYMRGKEELTRVQGALRPLQLYEYVFPEECYPEVLGMMEMQNRTGKERKEFRAPAWILRKAMGLKPMPIMDKIKDLSRDQITNKYVPTEALAIYPVGIKSDIKQDFIFNLKDGSQIGYYQEGL